jgi:phosphate transport system substrate-binding protein
MNRFTTRVRTLSARTAAVSLAGAAIAAAAIAPSAGASTSSTLASVERSLAAVETPPSSNVTLNESGSSLFGPLFQEWQTGYPHSNISLQPSVTSSGKGVAAVIAGTSDIGASDPYLPPIDLNQGYVNVPVVVSAQQIDYNIPGLSSKTHLKLSPTVLNSIYTGKITNWADPAIKAINKGVTIPSLPIVTIHRADSSGDTFLFTSYLDFGLGGSVQNPSGGSSFVASQGGPLNQPTWPSVPNSQAQTGNSGMLSACEATTGCIAYIGISYLNSALSHHLGYALLENHAKQFVPPMPMNIAAEVAAFQHVPTNGVDSLIFAQAKQAKFGYPIVNFEYAIVKAAQADPTKATAIRAFLAWAMDPKGGATSRFLAPVHFQALPASVLQVALGIVKTIR